MLGIQVIGAVLLLLVVQYIYPFDLALTIKNPV